MTVYGQFAVAAVRGLLRDGVRRCRELDPSLDQSWEARILDEIQSGDLDDLLGAAEKVSRKLGYPLGGEWSRWLRESAGQLAPHDEAVPKAISDLKAPILTTNYDGILDTQVGGAADHLERSKAGSTRVAGG